MHTLCPASRSCNQRLEVVDLDLGSHWNNMGRDALVMGPGRRTGHPHIQHPSL
jgi:hypothetical protein